MQTRAKIMQNFAQHEISTLTKPKGRTTGSCQFRKLFKLSHHLCKDLKSLHVEAGGGVFFDNNDNDTISSRVAKKVEKDLLPALQQIQSHSSRKECRKRFRTNNVPTPEQIGSHLSGDYDSLASDFCEFSQV